MQAILLEASEALAEHNNCTSTIIDVFGIDEFVVENSGYWLILSQDFGGQAWNKMIEKNVGNSSRQVSISEN